LEVEIERWFRERTQGFEKLLIRGALCFFALLLVSQALMSFPSVRRTLNIVDRLEGEPFLPAGKDGASPARPVYEREGEFLELALSRGNIDGVLEVLVNGETVSVFSQSSTVTVPVRDGDVVEIDGDLPEQEIEVMVRAVSDHVSSPVAGKKILFFGTAEAVGWVTLAEQ
jgi:hypothetical protein